MIAKRIRFLSLLIVLGCILGSAGCGPNDQGLADQAKKAEESSGSVVADPKANGNVAKRPRPTVPPAQTK